MNQEIVTICNFSKYMSSKFQISDDSKYVKEIINSEEKYYEKKEIIYGQLRYIKIENTLTINWRNAIGARENNRTVSLNSIFLIEIESSNDINYISFNDNIADTIRQRKVFATSDISIKDNRIGGY